MLLNLYNLLITFIGTERLERCFGCDRNHIEHRMIIDGRELREGGRIRLFRDEKEHGLHQTSAIVYS